jgi:hypothetical protein
MKPVQKKIVFAAHDAGGMDAILPIFKKFKRNKKIQLLNLFSGPALKISQREKIVSEDAEKYKMEEIEKMVSVFQPDLIFTGTSSGIHIEKILLRIARKLGFKILAIMDFWINYNLQFSFNPTGILLPIDLPDYILVMDDLAKKEMISEGFPAEKLIITGNPHFDDFKKFRSPAGVKEKIIFIDQHFSELVKCGIHEDLGYNELDAFSGAVSVLEEIGWKGDLIIKFHPGSQSQSRYDEIIKKSFLAIKKAPLEESLHSLFNKSNFVFGMTSILLFEAALGGKPVLSYQPGLKRKLDPLVTNRLGISHFAYSYPELQSKIAKLLELRQPTDIHQRFIDSYTKSKATERVIRFILSLIKN